MNAAEFLERFNDWIDSITDEELLDRLKNMKDKPPTESLESARKIAERMREARQYPAALPALPAPTDYERGFADHADFVQTWMQEQADVASKPMSEESSYDEYAAQKHHELAFRYVLERYNERNQAGLRKAAEAL